MRFERQSTDTPPTYRRSRGVPKKQLRARDQIDLQEKIAAALDYRRQGYTYEQIAEDMCLATSTVYGWISRGLKAARVRHAEHVVLLEISRLDLMQQKLLEIFLETPDPSYASSILAITDKRLKLLGITGSDNSGAADDLAKAVRDRLTASVVADRPVLVESGAAACGVSLGA